MTTKRRDRGRYFFFPAALWLACLFACAANCDAKEVRYLTGDARDVKPKLFGPAYDLAGGGGDVERALQWMIDEARGCRDCATKLDVVVLRSSGADGYNDFIFGMKGVDSVETLVITSRADADSRGVRETVRGAEVIFFAGGDQCNYVKYFKGTEVERGVESVHARGGGIGGTSAGLAIQGGIVYDACSGGSAQTFQSLRNPYHADITFTYDFFRWPHFKHIVTDTHFARRDRMGRTLAFVARQLRDRKAKRALGMGVDEKTSVVVDRTGVARVMGDGAAYFVLGDHQPEMCEPGMPLTYSNFKIWKVTDGGAFDLKKLPASGFSLVSVKEGKILSNPY